MLFESTYGNSGDFAMDYSANQDVTSRLHLQGSYLVSHPDNSPATDAFVGTVQEILNSRFTVSETINSSNGQNTFGFGGSFLSNLATLSADYETYYVPARVQSPFEQALIVNAQIHLFGRLTLTGGTFVGADGKLLYTAEAEGAVSRQQPDGAAAFQHYSIGSLLIKGRVLVDQLTIYSDSGGYFYVRERKPHIHPLTVLVGQFLNGGTYRVVSAPAEAKSSSNENQVSAMVIVEKMLSGRT